MKNGLMQKLLSKLQMQVMEINSITYSKESGIIYIRLNLKQILLLLILLLIIQKTKNKSSGYFIIPHWENGQKRSVLIISHG